MTGKIKIGGVKYLNTLPLLYGIKKNLTEKIEIVLEYPSLLAKHLKEDIIDIALLPVAAILDMEHAAIVGDYGIAAEGSVASVCLYSDVPIEDISEVYLDYQSRTSVKLAQVLLKEYWKKKVEFLDAEEDYIQQIKHNRAGVIIGDRALEQLGNFKYVYDLAEIWKLHTGLPFVFAAWVANKKLPAEFINAFNEANAVGLQHIDDIVKQQAYPHYDLKKYFTENIQYRLTEEKMKGLQLFFEKLKSL